MYAVDQKVSWDVHRLASPPHHSVPTMCQSLTASGTTSHPRLLIPFPFPCPYGWGFGSINAPDPPSPWASAQHLSPYLSPERFIFLLRGAVVQPCLLCAWFQVGHHYNHLASQRLSTYRYANTRIWGEADFEFLEIVLKSNEWTEKFLKQPLNSVFFIEQMKSKRRVWVGQRAHS